MPFNIQKAAAQTDTIEMDVRGQKVKVTYNSGVKFKKFRKATEKLDFEQMRLAHRLQVLMRSVDVKEEEIEAVAKGMDGARRKQAEIACMPIESWNIKGNLAEVVREFYEQASDEEVSALSKDDRGKLDSAEDRDGQDLPIEGLWLYVLPYADDFIQLLLRDINADYDAGGTAGKG